MTDPNATGLLTSIGAALGGLTALIGAGIKVAGWASKRRGADRREDRESFESVNDRLRDENTRCWAENERIRREYDEDCAKKDQDLAQCEEALKVRREQVHSLSNMVMQYQLEEDLRLHGEDHPRQDPDENGHPR
jgi:hypothetical protein